LQLAVHKLQITVIKRILRFELKQERSFWNDYHIRKNEILP